jgi:MarR family transcriptional regulator, organic hydroperoxide resistance regulator
VPTDALGPALHALARSHRARLAALLAPHGIHAGQDVLLLAIWEEPGLRQATLASRLGVEPPTVTRMLQRLERSGMVERRADPHDARVLRVHPTPRSRLLEGTVRRAWAALDEIVVAEMGEQAAEQLRKLADGASAALRADTMTSVE